MTIESMQMALEENRQTVEEITHSIHRLSSVLGIPLPDEQGPEPSTRTVPPPSSVFHAYAENLRSSSMQLSAAHSKLLHVMGTLLDGSTGLDIPAENDGMAPYFKSSRAQRLGVTVGRSDIDGPI